MHICQFTSTSLLGMFTFDSHTQCLETKFIYLKQSTICCNFNKFTSVKWGYRRQSCENMLVITVQFFAIGLLLSGSLASYGNGNSRYQQFIGCNGSSPVPADNSQDDSPSTVPVPPDSYYPVSDHKLTSNYPSTNYYKPVILNNPQQNYLGYTNNNNEVNEDRIPSLLRPHSNRFAQLYQSVSATRNQITGNRFFEMDNSVKFALYTRNNPSNGQTIQLYTKESIDSSDFKADKPTKLIIHGFSEIGALGEWVAHLKDAYLSTSEANVIVADFSTFETFLLFWTNLPIFASKRIADLITFLELTAGASRENFHLIARSWGTHVVGVTGRLLQGRVGRITGLEPEPRVYGSVLPDYRLVSSDAQFVDIIRVNGRRFFFHGSRFGMTSPTGHVDIYPNFSERNTGCSSTTSGSYWRANSGVGYCHKGRGVSYYIDSIKYPQSHQMCLCRSYLDYKSGNCPNLEAKTYCNFYMGEYLNNQTRGVFQLANSPKNSGRF